MVRIFSFLILLSTTCIGCIRINNPFTVLPPGSWHAELQIEEDLALPFNIEVTYDADQKMHFYLVNGEEKIESGKVLFGRNSMLDDTLEVQFPLMDSHISAEYKENVIEGAWHVHNRPNYSIPFVAYHGQSHRFTTTNETPALDLTGRWKTTFGVETEDEYPAIGEFKQSGNKISGTFLTETGDYRYLAGEVQGKKLMLSCFDGSHAFLFTADITDAGQLIGTFWSGEHFKTNWIAIKDEGAELASPYELSKIINPEKPIDFTLPNTQGVMVSLSDEKYAGKPKLISIMGTWCPNCLDESKFILQYLEEHPKLDVEVIAIAFERRTSQDAAIKQISRYKERLKIPYPILYGGAYEKDMATTALGFIDQIISYPTLLFVDRKNVVHTVHTGFSGPATSEYDAFRQKFEEEISYISQ